MPDLWLVDQKTFKIRVQKYFMLPPPSITTTITVWCFYFLIFLFFKSHSSSRFHPHVFSTFYYLQGDFGQLGLGDRRQETLSPLLLPTVAVSTVQYSTVQCVNASMVSIGLNIFLTTFGAFYTIPFGGFITSYGDLLCVYKCTVFLTVSFLPVPFSRFTVFHVPVSRLSVSLSPISLSIMILSHCLLSLFVHVSNSREPHLFSFLKYGH